MTHHPMRSTGLAALLTVVPLLVLPTCSAGREDGETPRNWAADVAKQIMPAIVIVRGVREKPADNK